MLPSVSVFPGTSSLAADSGMPLSIMLNLFDPNLELPVIPYQKLAYCPKCKVLATKIFKSEGHVYLCPYCKIQINCTSKEQVNLGSYILEKEASDQYKLMVIFALDLLSEQYDLLGNVGLIKISLSSLPPNSQFGICLYGYHTISFIKVLNHKAYSIDCPFDSNFFNLFSPDFILNSTSEVEIIFDLLDKLAVSALKQTGPLNINLAKFFEPPTTKTFVHIVVFSPNTLISNFSSQLSFDWIGNPSPKSTADGLTVDPSKPDAAFQVHALVCRLFDDPIALDARVELWSPSSISASPTNFKRSAVRMRTKMTVKLSYSWLSASLEAVPIVSMARSTVHRNGKFTIRVVVTSKVYPTTHDMMPFLRSINAPVLWASIPDGEETEVVQKLLEVYNRTKQILPGNPEPDSMFELLPNMEWIARYAAFGQERGRRIVEAERLGVFYFPSVSIWRSQNELLEDNVTEEAWETNEAIVVIDAGTEIHVFIDGVIETGTDLDNEIQRRTAARFPVPHLVKIERNFVDKFFQTLASRRLEFESQ